MNKFMIIIGAFSSENGAIKYAKQLEKDGYPTFIIEYENDEIKEVKNSTSSKKTTKELVDEVMKLGLNGEERKKYLGNRYDEVQTYINSRH